MRFSIVVVAAAGLSGCVPLPGGLFSSQKIDLADQVAAADSRDRNNTPDPLAVHYGGLALRMPVAGTPGRYRWTPLCHGPYSDITAADIYREIPADSTFWRDAFAIGVSTGGIDVTSNPQSPFETAGDLTRAEYTIAPAIIGLEVSLCRKRGWLTGDALGTTGEAEIVVDWRVYSRLSRQLIRTIRSRGAAKLRTPHGDALSTLTMAAFERAASKLAATPALRATLERPYQEALASTVEGKAAAPKDAGSEAVTPRLQTRHAPLRIPQQPLFSGTFGQRSAWIGRAIVSIPMPDGRYGSGFIVSEDGHILTNVRVVGDAARVRIEFSRERWIEGTVIRRDRRLGIALVKLATRPPGGLAPLPLRLDPLAVGSTVFTIAPPGSAKQDERVSRGIVSSHRTRRGSGSRLIQADITVYPGSIGGPLLDRSGNVIGIRTAITADRYDTPGTNLSYFVPVGDALRLLNLNTGPTQLSQTGDDRTADD